MGIGDDILIERLSHREEQLSQQSDTLDVKASILLVAITFLAGQSADLLGKHPHGWIHWVQIASISLQVLAGVLLALQLRVTVYKVEISETYPMWRDDLVEHFKGSEGEVISSLKAGIVKRSSARLEQTSKYNNRKASWVDSAFWVTLVSLACNLVALAPLIFD